MSFDLTQEAGAVNAWLRRQGARGGSRSGSWNGLAAGFLLGCWIGSG